MPGRWHNAIRDTLFELCETYDPYDKVWDGNKRPIGITVGRTTYYYQPDIYATYERSQKVDVYEVIDSESDGELVMDLVYSALTPRAETIGMVFSDAKKLETAKNHAKIILGRLCQESFTIEGSSVFYEPLSDLYQPKYFVHIPKRMLNRDKIRKSLRRGFEFK